MNYVSPVEEPLETRCERKRVAFASSAVFSLPNGQAFRVAACSVRREEFVENEFY